MIAIIAAAPSCACFRSSLIFSWTLVTVMPGIPLSLDCVVATHVSWVAWEGFAFESVSGEEVATRNAPAVVPKMDENPPSVTYVVGIPPLKESERVVPTTVTVVKAPSAKPARMRRVSPIVTFRDEAVDSGRATWSSAVGRLPAVRSGGVKGSGARGET